MIESTEFDPNRIFKMGDEVREKAAMIYQYITSALSEMKISFEDTTIIDALSYEILRLCITGDYNSSNPRKFTKTFLSELKKESNLNMLAEMIHHYYGLDKKLINVGDTFFKVMVHNFIDANDNQRGENFKPIFRREVESSCLENPEDAGLVPFWVEPRDKFSEALFFFRFSLLLSQSELNLSRSVASRLIEEIRLQLQGAKNSFERSMLRNLPHQKSLIQLGKLAASDLSLSWVVIFTHHDYGCLLNWKKIEKMDGLFIRKYVANVLGPLTLELMKRDGPIYFKKDLFDSLQKEVKGRKQNGKVFRLESHADKELLKIYRKRGHFRYSRILFSSEEFDSKKIKYMKDWSFFF